MRKYHVGQKVQVEGKHGTLVEGEILDPMDFAERELYWVQVFEDGVIDVNLFWEYDLDEWNTQQRSCCCGSQKTGSPGHSQWCGAYAD